MTKQIGEYFSELEKRPPSFDEWWGVYPRKASKKKAQVIYEKLSDEEKSACFLGTVRQVEDNPQWQGDDKFIPLPTTFLNQARWEDAIPQTVKQKMEQSQSKDAASVVWRAMTEMFGQAWLDRHGNKPSEIWKKMLQGFTDIQIKRGLRYTYDSGSEFPPSLPKFAEYCKPTFGERHPDPQLPRPPSDPEKALAAIAEMKRILTESKRG